MARIKVNGDHHWVIFLGAAVLERKEAVGVDDGLLIGATPCPQCDNPPAHHLHFLLKHAVTFIK